MGTETLDLYPYRAADYALDRLLVRELKLNPVQLLQIAETVPPSGRQYHMGSARID